MNKKILHWDDVFTSVVRLRENIKQKHGKDACIYGVPRGGAIVAGLLYNNCNTFKIVDTPARATVIVDDIVDSGRTRDLYQAKYPNIPFAYLYLKENTRFWIEFPWERGEEKTDAVNSVVRMLEWIGEDVNRAGLKDTPERVVKSWGELYLGYKQSPADLFARRFEQGTTYDQMITVSDIDFFSMCEHHLMPFYGQVMIGYIPNGEVVGLSKLPRLVEIYCRRLQVQERMTEEIAKAIMDYVNPKGVGVVVKGKHTCMCGRGVKKNAEMKTVALHGVFRDLAVRQEFLAKV